MTGAEDQEADSPKRPDTVDTPGWKPERPDRPKQGNEPKPVAYWAVKVILGLAIAGLAAAELFTGASVSPVVYVLLAALAGGPEVTDWLRKST